MILLLAFRHLLVRPVRALILLAGFGVGVGVMIVLLAVGEAMIAQSRDVSLIGGGEVTVLPEGVDLEALRTGALSAAFHGVDRARFVHRQLLDGPRSAAIVAGASPVIEHKIVYLETGGQVVALLAGGEIPSRSAAAGAGLDLLAGAWVDARSDSAWILPATGDLYHELDRWHLPAVADSSWGEWHYYNLVTGPAEWWYISYLVGGEIPGGRWGGQLLVTHRRPDGRHVRYEATVPPERIRFDTSSADLDLGGNSIQQANGTYRIRGSARAADGQSVRFDLEVVPSAHRWFPPLELRDDAFVSGYVVPAMRAVVGGEICFGGMNCRTIAAAPAYHDHNWGIWRGVSWEWGMGRGTEFDLLYGGILTPDSAESGQSPFLLAITDSLGVRQVLRFAAIEQAGSSAVAGRAGLAAPATLRLVAWQGTDSVTVSVRITAVHATEMGSAGFARVFLQMRGEFELEGRIGGSAVRDRGEGFFETWRGGDGE
jgi:hypothetical protein